MDLVEVNFDIQNRHPWETARLKSVAHIISKHTKSHLKEPLQVLDVGSGDAFVAHSFTKLFKNSTSYCVDIEYTDEITKTISSLFNNKNLHLYNDLNAISLEKNNIDIVTLLDVIEHVPDDVWLLKQIASKPYINDQTKFIITVPAFQSLYSQHDDLLKHYRRYNLKLLKKSIESSGLKFVDGGYFFTSLIPPRILQLISEKIKKKEINELTNLGKWNKGQLLTKIIHTSLYTDFLINRVIKKLNINIPGLSCYAVCSK